MRITMRRSGVLTGLLGLDHRRRKRRWDTGFGTEVHRLPPAGVLRCAPRGSNAQRISGHRPAVNILRVQAPFGCRHPSGAGTLPIQAPFGCRSGQISEPQLGLYFYNAKFYDPYLARFIRADALIPQPGNPLAWDRYSYGQNNPINYTDPTDHTITCLNDDLSKGCDGYGPTAILFSGLDTETTIKYLGNFFHARPNYRAETDPLVYGQESEYFIRTVQFQVEVEKIPSFEEQLAIELEKPQYEPILANKYTPLVSSAVSVLATDAAYLSLAIPHPGKGLTFGVSYLIGRFAGILSLSSTGYQYENNLNGTTKADVEFAAATTIIGSWPKPDMAVMTHVGFFYTFLRTYEVIQSPW